MSKKPANLASEFYDDIIDLHTEEFNFESIQYKKWLELLSSKLAKGDTVLDLGCGNGRALKVLFEKGFRVIGVDVSDKMLDMAKKHVPNGKFHKKDFTGLDFEPKSFNAIISFFAFNHIPKNDFRKVMKSCSKFLKKNGYLLLGMVKGNEEGYFSGFYGKDKELYGASYSEKEMTGILETAGFEIIKMDVSHFEGKHFEEDDIYILAKL